MSDLMDRMEKAEALDLNTTKRVHGESGGYICSITHQGQLVIPMWLNSKMTGKIKEDREGTHPHIVLRWRGDESKLYIRFKSEVESGSIKSPEWPKSVIGFGRILRSIGWEKPASMTKYLFSSYPPGEAIRICKEERIIELDFSRYEVVEVKSRKVKSQDWDKEISQEIPLERSIQGL